MIALIHGSFKSESESEDKTYQETYDALIKIFIAVLHLHFIHCPFCGSTDIIRWGFYTRYFPVSAVMFCDLRVQRIRCKDCGHTQAVMPVTVIPYVNILTLNDVLEILRDPKAWLDKHENNSEYILRCVSRLRKYYSSFLKPAMEKIRHTIEEPPEQFMAAFVEAYKIPFYYVRGRFRSYNYADSFYSGQDYFICDIRTYIHQHSTALEDVISDM